MRNRQVEPEEEDDINLTPMLDVVFIMLIFFIVTASFIKETGIEVQKPMSLSAVNKDRANILVGISEDGQIWIDKRQVELRAVRANIERLLSENPEGAVIIQADKKSKNGVMVKVLDAAKAAGVQDVSLSTERP
ncbi:MAG: biopolymer transporter ExbD [Myxococcota bacterium]|nr:biopolymer transporter ExbD [Myxococcota bacterium]